MLLAQARSAGDLPRRPAHCARGRGGCQPAPERLVPWPRPSTSRSSRCAPTAAPSGAASPTTCSPPGRPRWTSAPHPRSAPRCTPRSSAATSGMPGTPPRWSTPSPLSPGTSGAGRPRGRRGGCACSPMSARPPRRPCAPSPPPATRSSSTRRSTSRSTPGCASWAWRRSRSRCSTWPTAAGWTWRPWAARSPTAPGSCCCAARTTRWATSTRARSWPRSPTWRPSTTPWSSPTRSTPRWSTPAARARSCRSSR